MKCILKQMEWLMSRRRANKLYQYRKYLEPQKISFDKNAGVRHFRNMVKEPKNREAIIKKTKYKK